MNPFGNPERLERRLSSTSTSTQLSACSASLSPSTTRSSTTPLEQSSAPFTSSLVSDAHYTLPCLFTTDMVQSTSSSSNPSMTSYAATTPSKKNPPRPSNSFILYRRDQVKLFPKITAAKLSKILGQKWANETPEVKCEYAKRARDAGAAHAVAYPEYRYKPRKRAVSKRSSKAARSARVALKPASNSRAELAQQPFLSSQISQELSALMRVSGAYPYATHKNSKQSLPTPTPGFLHQSQHPSRSFQIKQEDLTELSFRSPSSSRKNKKSTHPSYLQPEPMKVSPSLFFVSSFDQKSLVQFVPSVPPTFPVTNGNSSMCIGLTAPIHWPGSSSTVSLLPGATAIQPSSMAIDNVGWVSSSIESHNAPSYSSDKGVSSSLYISQLMDANMTAAMSMHPPNKALVHESGANNDYYSQSGIPMPSYQALISSGLPCPIPKYTLSSHEHHRGPIVKTESVFLTPAMMEQDMNISPVLSTCSSYSSDESSSLLHDHNSGFGVNVRQLDPQDRMQTELVAQLLGHTFIGH